MERNFSNENLEEFLRHSSDGLRMRPSPKVWKAISGHLARRRWRMGLILGTSVLLTSALAYYLVNESSHELNNATHVAVPAQIHQNTSTKPASSAARQTNGEANDNGIAINQQQNFIEKQSPAAGTAIWNDEMPEPVYAANEAFQENDFTPTIVDSYFEGPLSEHKAVEQKEVKTTDPLSIESVVNAYRRPGKPKLSWQIYFTPTISYRKLNDEYINNVATHKPAFGFELGTTAKYPLSENLRLRAGLQFNVNRYEIKTFDSYAQMATIRLDNGNSVDYVNTVTSYNNFSGYKSNWLKNFYFQVSAPVGLELKVKGDDKVQFGVASTLQPTYLLGDRAYLISADYKNYAQMPNLVRRWNLNTNLETFVSYSTGHLNWQVGPQVRYQLLSSYVKKYPVKENLFDFGLKVGISLNNQ